MREEKPRDIKKAKELQKLDLSVRGENNFELALGLINGKNLILVFCKKKLDEERKKSGAYQLGHGKIREMLISDGYQKFFDILMEHYQEEFHLLFRCEVDFE